MKSETPTNRPSIAATVLRAVVRVYQLVISPIIGSRCRYMPTCSQYAIEAIERFGAIRGGRMALRRFFSCHPWGGFGYDPVPPGDSVNLAKTGSPSRHDTTGRWEKFCDATSEDPNDGSDGAEVDRQNTQVATDPGERIQSIDLTNKPKSPDRR